MIAQRLLVSVLVSGSAIGLAGCGSSGSSSAGSTPPPTSSMSSSAMSSSMSSSPMSSSMTSSPMSSSMSSSPMGSSAAATISIDKYKFATPAHVAPGAKITVINKDSVNHTVTADDKSFDDKAMAGSTTTFTAPSKPGRYPFVCSIHPEMHGVLVVQ